MMTHLPTLVEMVGSRASANARLVNGPNVTTTIPGFAVSAFFLWRTLRVIPYQTLRSIRFAHPEWMAILALFLIVGYGTRIYRWWLMMRPSGAPAFSVCGRVLLTSYAANNVLPFRIGDFLRVFVYADDLGASSSTVLSTVILERLLDVFTLLTFLVVALLGVSGTIPPLHIFGHEIAVLRFALPILALASLGLVVFLFGAASLDALLRKVIAKASPGPKLAKLEKWLLLTLDAVKQMSFIVKAMMLVTSCAVWFCEGMIFVSAAQLLGIEVGTRGPWLALALSNLSYLLPSSPGAIGTFEYFAKLGMISQGAPQPISAVYGLLVHVIVLFVTTGAGGIAFFVHRSHRESRQPLLEEINKLPTELS